MLRRMCCSNTLAPSLFIQISKNIITLPIRCCSTRTSAPQTLSYLHCTGELNLKVQSIVKALESDEQLLENVLDKMNPESRRRLVIAGGAAEWFGKEKIEQEVAAADVDKDQFISPKDFDNWFSSAIRRFPENRERELSNATVNPYAVPLGSLVLIAIEAGLPFVGFGFLDNSAMIIAGDAIDQTLGMYLHCSVMASAAMGNVVSGMCGMQVHGLIENTVHRLKLPTPILTEEQRKSQRVFMAGHLGGTLGIAIGLLLGMLPLLVIHDEDHKIEVSIFNTLDSNGDGEVSPAELRKGLGRIGMNITDESAEKMIQFYSNGKSTLSLEGFKDLCKDIKSKIENEEKNKLSSST
eukprot:Tbor_TRINITY_DN5001_c0_g3::TRINITY_DN5001_c0_g3_i1::g.14417::m.14417